ncbi:MAG: tRNA (guanosine(37)-N1)-methyltransferase TrmD [Candidatus Binatia bacterium]
MISFDVLTLFPEFIEAGARVGVLGRAIEAGHIAVRAHQLRDYTGGSPHPIDDSPYGGGPGMVMRAEPIYAAVEDVRARFAPQRRILLTPQGSPFTQASARRLAGEYESLLLFCGRYEGVDERVRHLFDEEISIGDYVLTGGELGALVVVDAVSRLVPGVLGSSESSSSESFSEADLLEYPQYTRPADFRGMTVPSVLTSGNHAEIERWRREQAAARTVARRPDLAARRSGKR